MASNTWNGENMTQEDFMQKDTCILLNNDDQILGNASKYDTHVFSPENPRGLLHRAFSVFLFNEEGKLLLQQRAASKITFPNVWTNTCCSHPLYGYTPSEVDDAAAVASGTVPGVKYAAIRKLFHELGIPADEIPLAKFKFLTRLHYWAADVVTHGVNSPWGEHEIDYILFIQAKVTCNPHPDEVQDIKYVSLPELQQMMSPSSGLLWSPWFRIIAEQFLPHWWANLNETLTTDKFVDTYTIHRFDPTEEHMGGAGKAGAWLGKASNPYESKPAKALLKQGAYGKVQIHKHSKLSQLIHLDEVFAALSLKYGGFGSNTIDRSDENVRFCDDMLGKVSRSFAMVIRQLPQNLILDILIFYLTLRALDTVEDDMVAFKGKEYMKVDHLNNFYCTALVEDDWCMKGVGEGDERTLIEQFYRCTAVFKRLSPASQEVISDITKRMGRGMASFVEIDLGQGTVKVADYNLYCHYVAGLVGEGLSRLFHCNGYESAQVAAVSTTLANTMGLFLQKTNIIRDYLEDYVDGRTFWPQEIWKQYTTTGELGELARADARGRAVQCLNHLVTDALECVPECLEYMALLRTKEVFHFCAIPQIMAIATMAELYGNPLVFTGVVKIRKGMSAKLMIQTDNVDSLHYHFNHFAKVILGKVKSSDPNAKATRAICNKIIAITAPKTTSLVRRQSACKLTFLHGCATLSFISRLLSSSSVSMDGFLPVFRSIDDVRIGGALFGSAIFLFGMRLLTKSKHHLKKADH